ncbi:MAG: hypothetical protein JWQ85_3763 [Mucilaginibacter sp.]|nr:hypothetical protein [Mucilaginibacter sp.]
MQDGFFTFATIHTHIKNRCAPKDEKRITKQTR